jgi:release factor glutamine methyltransferase
MTDTLDLILRDAVASLAAAGVPEPRVDAELLAAHVLSLSRGGVQAAAIRGDTVAPMDAATFAALVTRRAAREPLQHLTGRAPFRHFELEVGPGVFVPRPETEMLAQLAIDALRVDASPTPAAVDLGTGSGAIAIAMATEVPHARVYAVERSPEAFAWASRNAARLAPDNLEVVLGDLADAVESLERFAGTFTVVASNPPYVPDEAIPRDPEVRLFDPPQALYGGPDGLDVVRVLSRVGLALARSGGLITIEHGEWQGDEVRAVLAGDGWRAAATHPDLTRRDRVTTALRP